MRLGREQYQTIRVQHVKMGGDKSTGIQAGHRNYELQDNGFKTAVLEECQTCLP